MLTLQDIKKRLTKFLVQLTEDQAQRFESFENDTFFQLAYGETTAEQFRDEQKQLYTNRELQEKKYYSWLRDRCYEPLTDSFNAEKLEAAKAEPFDSEKFFVLFAEIRSAYLTANGYFTKKEFEENKAAIGKALMQIGLVFNEYVVRDEAGDILGTQKILSDFLSTATPLQIQQQDKTKEKDPPKTLYSQAVEKYITSKQLENAWKKHNVPDIKTRLDSFLDIIGDMPITAITRNDMRRFMEVLQQLPPHRMKLTQYKSKSIQEILAMKPPKTLNVATVNTKK